jgi:hypothetical protein
VSNSPPPSATAMWVADKPTQKKPVSGCDAPVLPPFLGEATATTDAAGATTKGGGGGIRTGRRAAKCFWIRGA